MGQRGYGDPEGAVWSGLILTDTDKFGEEQRDPEHLRVALRGTYDPWAGSAREYVWQDDAACQGQPLELFFTDSRTSDDRERLEGAIQDFCQDCPVKSLCFAEAQPSDMHYSVRGGLLPAIFEAKRPDKAPAFKLSEYELWECALHGRANVLEKPNGKDRKLAPYCGVCRQVKLDPNRKR